MVKRVGDILFPGSKERPTPSSSICQGVRPRSVTFVIIIVTLSLLLLQRFGQEVNMFDAVVRVDFCVPGGSMNCL